MNEKNVIVRMMDWIVDTLAKTLVSLFDGVKSAVDHSNPSLFALVATLLPFALPLPVAFMTSHSAQTFFHWDAWAANTLGFGLEGLGLLVWVKLVDGIIAEINNEKLENYVTFLWCVAIGYEAILILLNVVLAWNSGASLVYAVTLLLICLLPALSAAMYGLHRRETITQLAREHGEVKEYQDHQRLLEEQRQQEEIEYQRQLAERIRQERREDALKRAEMKLQYSSDVQQEQPFRGKRS